MRIHSESVIHHPREAVFEAYRDRLSEVAVYIPDIRQIDVLDRREEGTLVSLHNEWVADREIPKIARGFIRPEMLRWDDWARWDVSTQICTWKLGIRAFPEGVKCMGSNTFVDLGGGRTKVVLGGDLTVDVKKIPGVPRLLAGRVGPQVERFIVSLITPNLERVNSSLGRFLDDNG